MTVQSGQKIVSIAALSKAGAMPVDTGGAQVASMLVGGGTFTANGASVVTVNDTRVTANSVIIFTLKTVGGTVGAIPAIQTITPGTGFTVAGTASDTSVYNYAILG